MHFPIWYFRQCLACIYNGFGPILWTCKQGQTWIETRSLDSQWDSNIPIAYKVVLATQIITSDKICYFITRSSSYIIMMWLCTRKSSYDISVLQRLSRKRGIRIRSETASETDWFQSHLWPRWFGGNVLNLGNRGAYWDRVRWLLRSSVHEGPWPMMDRLVVQNSPKF